MTFIEGGLVSVSFSRIDRTSTDCLQLICDVVEKLGIMCLLDSELSAYSFELCSNFGTCITLFPYVVISILN